jgi:hypothetical protein
MVKLRVDNENEKEKGEKMGVSVNKNSGCL